MARTWWQRHICPENETLVPHCVANQRQSHEKRFSSEPDIQPAVCRGMVGRMETRPCLSMNCLTSAIRRTETWYGSGFGPLIGTVHAYKCI